MSAANTNNQDVEIRAQKPAELALPFYYAALWTILTLVGGYIVIRLWPILIVLIISTMIVASLNPLVKRIQPHVGRKAALSLVVVGLLVVIAAFVAFTIPNVIAQMSTLGEDFNRVLGELKENTRNSPPFVRQLITTLQTTISTKTPAIETVKEVTFTSLLVLTGFITTIMLSSYLLVEGSSTASSLLTLFPRKNRLMIRQFFGEIGEQVGAYLRGQVITSLIAGTFTFTVLSVFQVPNALALGWLMAIADAIPIVGPAVGIVPAAISAYGHRHDYALAVLIILVAYHQFENYFIVPRVYSKALRLPAVAILVSTLVGATLLGMAGAFLALPVAAAIPTILKYLDAWRAAEALEETLGDAGTLGIENNPFPPNQ